MTPDTFTAEQEQRARELWQDGSSLGEVALAVGCSIYDLSPWLYVEELRMPRSGGDAESA